MALMGNQWNCFEPGICSFQRKFLLTGTAHIYFRSLSMIKQKGFRSTSQAQMAFDLSWQQHTWKSKSTIFRLIKKVMNIADIYTAMKIINNSVYPSKISDQLANENHRSLAMGSVEICLDVFMYCLDRQNLQTFLNDFF